jgi:hypothetical protein
METHGVLHTFHLSPISVFVGVTEHASWLAAGETILTQFEASFVKVVSLLNGSICSILFVVFTIHTILGY